MDFLAAGSSGYPLDLLARTGVDLSGPGPVREAMAEFKERLAELKAILEMD